MGFQPSSKLSTTDGWWAELWCKRVPDGWGCNMETPSAELCSCRRDKYVVAFCRTKICPTRNAGDWDADIVEVGRTVLTDTVKRRDCYVELYSLWHWQPMKHVAKSRRDVFVSANTDDQTGGRNTLLEGCHLRQQYHTPEWNRLQEMQRWLRQHWQWVETEGI